MRRGFRVLHEFGLEKTLTQTAGRFGTSSPQTAALAQLAHDFWRAGARPAPDVWHEAPFLER